MAHSATRRRTAGASATANASAAASVSAADGITAGNSTAEGSAANSTAATRNPTASDSTAKGAAAGAPTAETPATEKLTAGEASARLGVSVDTIRRWAKLGLLRCTRDERNIRRFDPADIERAKAQHSTPKALGEPKFRVLGSPPSGLTSVELFAGAGGTALGLENAGFEHLLLFEVDSFACQTLRENRPQWNVAEGDVHALNFAPFKGKVNLLQGGVPCQAFSYAGKSKGFGDTRGTLFFEFARAISECKPDTIMMENVRGLLTHDGGSTLRTMLGCLMDEGYRVAVKVLRAQFLDVAQKRERLVILGVREDLDVPLLFPRQEGALLTLWDAIGDCPESEGAAYPQRKREILELVPPGGYWKDLPDDIQREYLKGSYHLPGGKTGMARRLAWNEPSLTLTCAPAQKQTERCHPEHTRPLTVREYARIQSFPDEWQFTGSMANKYKQIGNAVPVNMAYHIGRAIRAMLAGEGRECFAEAQPLTRKDLESDNLRKTALAIYEQSTPASS